MSAPSAIVVGLGVMGAAIAAELAGRGWRVTGVDRHRPPHDLGSSHGGSRIIRRAYFEGGQYVPLVERAYPLWRRLEESTGKSLLVPTGGLTLGAADGDLVRGAVAAAVAHGVDHELLSAAEVSSRFRELRLAAGEVAVWDPEAGLLRPEVAVEALLERASAAGATLEFEEPVTAWRPIAGGGIEVETARGRREADFAILAAGAWMPEFLGRRLPLLTAQRVVQHWFSPRERPANFLPGACPVWVWEYAPGRIWYGLPDVGDGVKAALHYQGVATRAETVDRRVAPEEVAAVRRLLERHLPAAAGQHRRSAVCLYTLTADLDFLLDRHPEASAVYLVSACSGHGFKFAPAVAEAVADELDQGRASPALEPFRLGRLLEGDGPAAGSPEAPTGSLEGGGTGADSR